MWIPSYEAKDHLAMAGPHGVGRINFVQMTWYGTDHSYILDLIAAEPDRFVGTGIVPAVTDIDVGSPSRQMSALARGGVYAFRVRGGSARPGLLAAGPRWLDHPGYHEMFEAGARENLAISFLMDPVDIPEVDRMCGLYPDTPVIVDHLCRIGADGELREEDIAAFCGLAKHRGVLVKVGPFNHLGAKVKPYLDVLPLVERTIDAFGPERCMWESDSPALRPGNYDATRRRTSRRAWRWCATTPTSARRTGTTCSSGLRSGSSSRPAPARRGDEPQRTRRARRIHEREYGGRGDCWRRAGGSSDGLLPSRRGRRLRGRGAGPASPATHRATHTPRWARSTRRAWTAPTST